MSLGQLFASITERRRRSAQQACEEGDQIRRRLQELLAVPPPQRKAEPAFTDSRNESERAFVQG